MILLAMDRATVRRRDANGFLHVETSHISKANVCSYYGREIPGAAELGLDMNKVYRLYRDPVELEKAAPTFNNLPLLSQHLPVIPDELPGDLIIGALGNDAAFDGTYLDNSKVVWCADAQHGIETNKKRELSCGYRYRADMTPGMTREGLQYDGVMRDIIGNHVALVFEGRAGPDVLVGDEAMKLKSRTALMISGALAAHIRPLLAQDAKVDISTALKDVTAQSLAMDGAPAKLATAIVTLATPHLAADKTLDADALTATISAIQPLAADEDTIEDKPAAPAPKVEPSPTTTTQADDKPQALDQATVTGMIAEAEKRGAANVAAIEVAKRDVAPFVGEVVGLDSAPAIYRLALDAAEVDLTGVDPTAYKAMVSMLPKPADNTIALDRAPVGRGKLAQIIPNLPPLHRS